MLMNEKKLFLLDAYALIYRSYYAFIKNPRINSKGENTSAIFGFLNTLEDLIRKEHPTHLGVGFDPSGKTFRHEAYEAYKATREETPETIRWSVPYIKSLLQAYNIPILEVEGFEADDVIGTIATKAGEKGYTVYMMTPDKDYGQLVKDNVFIYKPVFGSSDYEVLGPRQVCDKYGLANTGQVIDLLSLMGDSADNIPGCPGIGKVFAQKLIAQFGSCENLLQHTDELKGALKEKVIKGADDIKFSKFLATIRTDVPIEFDEECLRMNARSEERVFPLLDRLEIRSWINRSETRSYPAAASKVENSASTETFGIENSASAKSSGIENSASGKVSVIGNSLSSKTAKGEISEAGKNGVFENSAKVEASKKEEAKAKSGKKKSTKIQTDEMQLSLWDEDLEIPETKVDYGNSNSDNSSGKAAENYSDATESTGREKESNLGARENWYFETHLVENENDNDFITALNSCTEKLGICTKWEGKNLMEASITEISLAFFENTGKANTVNQKKASLWKIPNPSPTLLEKIRPAMENPNIEKIGYNLKADLILLGHRGIQTEGPLFDTQIAHYLLQPEVNHSLENLCRIYLDCQLEPLADTAEKMQCICRLDPVLRQEATHEQLDYLLYQVEMPLIAVLADMEITGVHIDSEELRQYSKQLTQQLTQTENDIFTLAGESFNVNSNRQVGEILFDKLKLADKAKKTKKTGQYSTSEEVLEKMRDLHPIVGKLLEYRGIKKLLSTYVDAFPLWVNASTGRIHTSFNQAITATGRLSSSNPNLQNIPVRDEMGKEMRRIFTAEPGCLFLSADYSQIELRLMACLSGDQNMIEDFLNDYDIHQATAAKVFKTSLENVSKEMRQKAKTANFGIIYGISTFGLAERMHVSRQEAKELIDGYFETYPQIKEYMDKAIGKAQENLFVETMFHRKRYLPDIVSHNSVVRGYAERNAINAPIQGTAADIIKIAMVNIHRALKQAGLKTKMILQVHDELNFMVPMDEVETVKKLVGREMESAVSLAVPLKADIGVGDNWLQAH